LLLTIILINISTKAIVGNRLRPAIKFSDRIESDVALNRYSLIRELSGHGNTAEEFVSLFRPNDVSEDIYESANSARQEKTAHGAPTLQRQQSNAIENLLSNIWQVGSSA